MHYLCHKGAVFKEGSKYTNACSRELKSWVRSSSNFFIVDFFVVLYISLEGQQRQFTMDNCFTFTHNDKIGTVTFFKVDNTDQNRFEHLNPFILKKDNKWQSLFIKHSKFLSKGSAQQLSLFKRFLMMIDMDQINFSYNFSLLLCITYHSLKRSKNYQSFQTLFLASEITRSSFKRFQMSLKLDSILEELV